MNDAARRPVQGSVAGLWALAFLTIGAAWPAIAGPSREPSGRYVSRWLLLGPFEAGRPELPEVDATHLPKFEIDFLAGAGGERQARPRPGDVLIFEGDRIAWTPHEARGENVDLDAALSGADYVLGYAYTEFDALGGPAILALGSNDGVRVWLNGRRLWDFPHGRGLTLDEDLLPVVLEPGLNRLLLKIEERGNRWGFACRLLPLRQDVLSEDLRLFELQPRPDGQAELRWAPAAEPAAWLAGPVRVNVVRRRRPEEVVWASSWSGAREPLRLGVDAGVYGEYLLRLEAPVAGGLLAQATIPFVAGPSGEHVLFEAGRSDYRIYLAAEASEAERWGAEELKRWLQEAGGAELPIQTGGEIEGDRVIFVGWSPPAARRFGLGQPPAEADESFLYRSLGPSIVILGGRQRGTMYGVMTFLEREFGCRWYTPRVTVVPRRERFAFRAVDHAEAPGIRVRNDFYFEAFDSIWAARNKVNGAMSYREQPGGVEAYWAVHTFYPLLPPETYFADHPEYYSLIEGRRTADRAQLCLTNPDVLERLTARLLEIMRANPKYLIYSVSQNDWRNPCQCDRCQAIARAEESEAGPVLGFVNQVAERVEREFPDKFIGTLAYQYTRRPPKTLRPRRNVVIRLCSIEACFAHDFTACPENAEFLDDLKGWARIAPRLYIWDYVVNFSHYVMPYPNFRVLKPNIRTFRDHHAIGIMEQAAYQSRGGEWAELRAYVLAKLLWNPEADDQAVVDDFLAGYYGRAAPALRRYFDLLHNQLTPATHIHLGLRPDDPIFSEPFIDAADALFDVAETVAETEDIRARVELARLPLLYLKCRRDPARARRDGSYERLRAIEAREGVTHYAEAGPPHREAFHAMMNR